MLHHLRQTSGNQDVYMKFRLNVKQCRAVMTRFGSEVDYQKAMRKALANTRMGAAAEHYGVGKKRILV